MISQSSAFLSYIPTDNLQEMSLPKGLFIYVVISKVHFFDSKVCTRTRNLDWDFLVI